MILRGNLLGSIPELEEITPKKLAEAYQELIEKNVCDIFIVGNVDMDNVANIIFKYFKLIKRINKEIPHILK